MTEEELNKILDAVKNLDKTPKRKEIGVYAFVRNGKWEVHEAFGYMDMTCSVCGWLYEYYAGLEEEWNFCPHCGAKMDGVNDE